MKGLAVIGYITLYLVRYGGYAASRNYGEEVTPTSTLEHHGPHTSADDAPAACKHRMKQPPNMWTTMLVWTTVVVLLPAPRMVNASGVFELRLKSFVNEYGKDSLGKCCSGSTSKTGECSGVCKTRFRVCLKQYQVKIDTTTPCTYGDVVTPVLGENIVSLSPNVAMPSFTNPIRFPFDFTWPDTTRNSNTLDSRLCSRSVKVGDALRSSLIRIDILKKIEDIECRVPIDSTAPLYKAQGDTTIERNESAKKVLITRLTTQKWLDVGPNWTEDEYRSAHAKMVYEYRVTCVAHYYGKGCENLCRPRDDNFGHYSCSPSGERVCLSGWKGDYCNTQMKIAGKTNVVSGSKGKLQQSAIALLPSESYPPQKQSSLKQPETFKHSNALCSIFLKKARCLPGCDEQHGHCSRPDECIVLVLAVAGENNIFENRRRPGQLSRVGVRGASFKRPRRPLEIYGHTVSTCHNGWKGAYCDQCVRYPGCLHGSCQKPWECLCDEGWGGLFCNQDLNYCTNHKPCLNGGTCFNTFNGQGLYTCSCAPGFNGTNCEKPLLDCDSNPCLNDSPCHHGATCEDDSLHGYVCRCLPGYAGNDCETQLDQCSPNPCSNGGTCTDLGNSFRCSCPAGFTGERCETNIDDCQGDPCLNGGTCVDLVNQFRCQCVPGYVGRLCQDKVDYCLTKPCANGGRCISGTNDYRCACKPGFTGKDCSVDVDECRSAPCRNGGTCLNRVNGFLCQCPEGWHGDTCSEEVGSGTAILPVPSNTAAVPAVPPSGASYWPGNLSRHVASASAEPRDAGLTTEHVVVIATLSTAVPAFVLVAAVAVMCMKRRQKREQAKADEEARLQNERNAVHSSMSKRSGGVMGGVGGGAGVGSTGSTGVGIGNVGLLGGGGSGMISGGGGGSVCTLGTGDAHMIKNTWTANKSVNNAASARQDDLDSSFQTDVTLDSSCSGYKPEPEKDCLGLGLGIGVGVGVIESAKRSSMFAGNATTDSCCAAEAALLKRPTTITEGGSGPPCGGGGGGGTETGCGVKKKEKTIENTQNRKEKKACAPGIQRRRREFESVKRRLIDHSFTSRPAPTLAGIRRPIGLYENNSLIISASRTLYRALTVLIFTTSMRMKNSTLCSDVMTFGRWSNSECSNFVKLKKLSVNREGRMENELKKQPRLNVDSSVILPLRLTTLLAASRINSKRTSSDVPSVKIQQFQACVFQGSESSVAETSIIQALPFPSPRGQNVLRKIFNGHCGTTVLKSLMNFVLEPEHGKRQHDFLNCPRSTLMELQDSIHVARSNVIPEIPGWLYRHVPPSLYIVIYESEYL
ncbi:Neurogenic locus protein delta [Melipona quadrifasciata]|uniref:Delta-like protein n=1 Tax=Melipona quadrifasciata TaxID=166423 RepID=A0A0N0U760_9HYME|nr:Neurogenic locus protein delta [Melipona quadrifasciata]